MGIDPQHIVSFLKQRINRFVFSAFFLATFVTFSPTIVFAQADIEAVLDTDDGTSGFSVQDSTTTEVFRVDSDGNVTVDGNLGVGVGTQTGAFDVEGGDVYIGTGALDLGHDSGLEDLLVTGNLEVEGIIYFDDGIYGDGSGLTGISAGSITDDSLDWIKLRDTMELDDDTTIDMDTNTADINFDANTLMIDSSADSVGVGTSTPSAELDVGGGAADDIDGVGDLLVADDVEIDGDLYVDGGIYFDGVIYGDGSGLTNVSSGSINDDSLDWIKLQDTMELDDDTTIDMDTNTADINFDVNTFMIDSSADSVGVGTSTPSAELDVGGGAADDIDGVGDLLVADDVEIDGDLYVDGGIYFDGVIYGDGSGLTNVSSGSINDDSLDWIKLQDTMELDDDTTIDMDTNTADINFDANTLMIDSSADSVGVGTSTPSAELDVGGGAADDIDGVGDLLVADDAEIDGSLYVDGGIYFDGVIYGDGSGLTNVSSGSINDDSLDWIKLQDTMELDDDTTIDMDTNTADINFDADTFMIDSSADSVGVGTSTPSAELDVGGGAADDIDGVGDLLVADDAEIDGSLYVDGGIYFDGVIYGDGSGLTGVSAGSINDDSLDWIKLRDTMELDDDTTIDMDTNTADINFDVNTFMIDSSADSVGVGTSTPSAELDVGGGAADDIDGVGDLLVADDVEIDGDLYVDGGIYFDGVIYGDGSGLTNVSSGSINDDSLDWIKLQDTMELDDDTTIDMDTNTADINFDANTLMIDSSADSVGVGTSTPSAELDVGDGVADDIDGVDDLLVADDVEIDGDLYVDGGIYFDGVIYGDGSGLTNVSSGSINDDSLDWIKLRDTMELDDDTTIDMDTNTADINFDADTFMIDSSADRVGIGTSVPAVELQVAGTIYADTAIGINAAAMDGILDIEGGDVFIGTAALDNTSAVEDVLVSGNVEVEGGIYADAGLYTEGWLGVGTTTPSGALDVEGGDVYIGTADFDAGHTTVLEDMIIAGNLEVEGIIYGNTQNLKVDKLIDTDGSTIVHVDAGGANDDVIRFTTSSVERVVIDSSGYVGIGTSIPDGSLQVAVGNAYFDNLVGIGTTAPSGALDVEGGDVFIGTAALDNTSAVEDLLVSGNVEAEGGIYADAGLYTEGWLGVGTTTPSGALDVEGGDVYIGTAILDNTSADEDLLVSGNLEVEGTIYVSNGIYGDGSGLTGVSAGSIADDTLDWDKLVDSMVLDDTTSIDMDTNSADFNFDVDTFVIDSSADRVGIGTATPDGSLQVAVGNAYFDNLVGIGTTAPSGALDVEGGDVFIGTAALDNTSAAEDLLVSGNVEAEGGIYADAGLYTQGWLGVGTTTPGAAVEITGSGGGDFAGDPALLYLTATDQTPWPIVIQNQAYGSFIGMYQTDAGKFHIEDTNTIMFSIDQTIGAQAVGILDADPDARLEVSGDGSTATDLLMVSTDSAGNGDVFIVKGTGEVGIGTIAPAGELQVAGTVYADTALGINTTSMDGILDVEGGDVFFGTAALDNTSAAEDLLVSGNVEVEGDIYLDGGIYGDGSGLTGISATSIAEDSLDWDKLVDSMVLDDTTSIDMDTNSADFNFDVDTFVIDSSADRVGIGTATPDGSLQVAVGNAYFDNLVGIGTTAPSGALDVEGGDVFIGTAALDNTSAVEDLLVSGNVEVEGGIYADAGLYTEGWLGVGTTTPSGALDVEGGDVYIGTAILDNSTSDEDLLVSGNLEVEGDIYLDGGIYGDGSGLTGVSAGSIADDALDWDKLVDSMVLDDTTSIDMDANNADFNFDADTFVIDSSADRVGIGTAAPSGELQVAGNIYADTAIGVGTVSPDVELHVEGTIYATTAIGVGTTAPAGELQVAGTVYADTALGINTTSMDGILDVEGGDVFFGTAALDNTSAAEDLLVSGNVEVEGGIYADAGLYTEGWLGVGTTTPSGVLDVEGGDVFFGTAALDNTSAVEDVLVSGNVEVEGGIYADAGLYTEGWLGVGTTTPSGALDVEGGDVYIGTAILDNTSADEDLLVSGNLEVEGDIYLDGGIYGDGSGLTGISAASIAEDSLDWDKLADSMVLDDTTSIDMDTNSADFNFDVDTFVIDSSADRVGIGTATPDGSLQVAVGNAYFDNLVGIGTTAPSGALDVEGGDVFIGTAALDNTSAAEDLLVSGNVEAEGGIYADAGLYTQGWLGVGTTTPGAAVEITGSGGGDFAGDPALLYLTATDQTPWPIVIQNQAYGSFIGMYQTDGGKFHIEDTNTIMFSIDQTIGAQAVGILDADPDARLEVSGDGSTATDLLMVSTDSAGNGDVFIVKGTGEVGIGTIAPAGELQVAGTVYADTALGINTTSMDGILDVEGGDVFFGTAALDNTSAAEDLLVSGNVEVEGDIYLDGGIYGDGSGLTGISATSIAEDSLDWDKLVDSMVLDDTTSIDMDTNSADFNFDVDTFVIDSSADRVGIGTATPDGSLQVAVGNAYFDNLVGIGTTAPSGALDVEGGDVFIGTAALDNTSAVEDLLVSGNVEVEGGIYADAGLYTEGWLGVGTTTPSGALDVEGGDVYIGTAILDNTSADEDLLVSGNVEVEGAIYADGGIYGDGSGLTGVSAGSIADDALDWDKLVDSMVLDDTTSIDMDANNADFNFDADTFVIDSSADRVGIGTAAPSGELQVAGNIYADTAIGVGTVSPDVELHVEGTIYATTAIGVGTTAPAGELQVAGTVYADTALGINTTSMDGILDVEGGDVFFGTAALDNTSAAEDLLVSGNVEVEGGIYADAGLYTEGWLGVGTTTPSGVLDVEGGDVFFGTAALDNTSAVEDVLVSGNVEVEGGIYADAGLYTEGWLGVGTTTPSGALDVEGGDVYIGTAILDNTSADEDLLVSGNLEVEGDIYLDGGIYGDGSGLTGISAASIADNSIDFDKLVDAMTLDATTSIDMDTNSADFNFDVDTFVIDSSADRVGIGTATPDGSLQVAVGNAYFDNLVGIGTTAPSGALDVEGGDVFIGTAALDNTSAVEDLLVSGNVEAEGGIYADAGLYTQGWLGVGTTTPGAAVEITGSGGGDFAGDPALLYLTATDQTPWPIVIQNQAYGSFIGMYQTDGGKFHIEDTNTIMFSIDQTIGAQAVGILDADPDARLEVSGDGSTATDLLMVSTDSAGNGDVFIVKGTGEVGIGTIAPAGELQVAGTVYADTALGINTTSMDGILDVEGGDVFFGTAALDNTSASEDLLVSGNVEVEGGIYADAGLYTEGWLGVGTTTPSGALDVEGGDVYIGTAILDNTTASEDLLVSGNLEVEGDIYFDGGIYGDGAGLTGISAASIADNSLDFDKFVDAMELDATTTIDMDTNNADFNFDADTFVIDSSADRVGIGTAAPDGSLQVAVGNAYFDNLVGIGTTDPDTKLHVEGTIYATTAIGVGTTAPAGELQVAGTVYADTALGINTTSMDGILDVEGGDVFFGTAALDNTSAAEDLLVSGNVEVEGGIYADAGLYTEGWLGVGTTTPSGALDVEGGDVYIGTAILDNTSADEDLLVSGNVEVEGNIYFDGAIYGDASQLTGLPSNDRIIDPDSSTKVDVNETTNEEFIRFDTNSVERMVINPAGYVGIGTASPDGSFQVAVGNAYFDNNVGIGTTAPAGELQVAGTVYADTALGINTTTMDGILDVEGGDVFFGTAALDNTSAVEDLLVSGNVEVEGGIYADAGLYTEGWLGVGTTTPSGVLDVEGGDAYFGTAVLDNTSAYEDVLIAGYLEVEGGIYADAGLYTEGWLGVGTTTPSGVLDVEGGDVFFGTAALDNTSSAEDLLVSGNVEVEGGIYADAGLYTEGWLGVGTTTPSGALDIEGGDVYIGTGVFDTGRTTGSEDMLVTGNVEIEGALYVENGIYGDTSGLTVTLIKDGGDGDTRVQTDEGGGDADFIRFDTAGTERMVIDPTGYVGIGTALPKTSLHVVLGNAYFDNNVGIGNTDPSGALDIEGGDVYVGTGILDIDAGADLMVTDNFQVDGQSYFDGNIGVGTITNQGVLDVVGGDAYIGTGTLDIDAGADLMVTDNFQVDGQSYFDGNIGVGTITNQGVLDIAGGDVYIGTAVLDNVSTDEDLLVSGNVEVEGNIYADSGLYTEGWLGVGTLTPSGVLDVEGGDAYIGTAVLDNASTTAENLLVSGNVEVEGNIYADSGIYTEGWVGIGTTAPSGALDIEAGDVYIGTGVFDLGHESADQDALITGNLEVEGSIYGDGQWLQNLPGGTLDQNYDGGGPGAGRTVDVNAGAIQFQGSNAADETLEVTSSGAGGVIFVENTGSGLSLRVDDVSGDTSPFVIDSTGYVGVGTALPSGSFHVAVGNAYFDNNIGIGTTAPSGKLDVEGGDVYFGTATLDNTSGYEDLLVAGYLEVEGGIYADAGLYTEGWLGVGTTTPSGALDVEGGDVYIGTAVLDNASANEDLLVAGYLEVEGGIYADAGIYTEGWAGIGTTAPKSMLDIGGGTASSIDGDNDILVADDVEINGDLYVDGGIYGVASGLVLTLIQDADDGNTRVETDESSGENIIRFDTAGTERLVIEADGDTVLGGGTLDIDSASEDLMLTNNLQVDGQSYFDGLLGIGTVAPDGQLHVAGYAYVDTAIGIGTTVLTGILDVEGGDVYFGTATLDNTSGYEDLLVAGYLEVEGGIYADAGLYTEGWLGVGTTTPSGALDVEGGDVYIGTAVLDNASANEDLLVAGYLEVEGGIYADAGIYTEGWAGIGTTAPKSMLDIGGGTASSIDGDNDILVADDVEINGDLYVDGQILGDGSQLTGTSVKYDDILDPDAASTINFTTYTNMWQSAVAAGDFFTIEHTGNANAFRVNDEASDVSPFIILGTGSVGIGTSTPSGQLQVAGNIYADTAIGVGTVAPSADLDIGGGVADHIDGTDDVLVANDLEVDGDLYIDDGLYVDGIVAFEPGTTNVGVGDSIAVTNAVMRIQSTGGAVDLSSTPQILAGSNDGEIVMLKGASDANTVKIDDLDGVRLNSGVSFTMGEGDVLYLMYDASAGYWVEMSRSDANP